jgi:hypothetical protein
MQKIVVLLSGSHFSAGAFEFIKNMRSEAQLKLTAVFLPEWVSSPIDAGEDEAAALKENMDRFEWLCGQYRIDVKMCADRTDFVLSRISRESRFADLLIAGIEGFHKNETGSFFLSMKDLLHEAECPVLLVPEKIYFPQHIILSYDGSASSVFAIRQFTYLFPDLCKKETILVYEGKRVDLPYSSYLKELTDRYFPALSYLRLDPEDDECFNSWVHEISRPMVVAGSFGPAGTFPLFRKGFISGLINQNQLLVFLARK